MAPFVSVIIPTYNSRRYLESAIKSVRVQTTNAEIEIIVIDDGSIDDTEEWVRNYAPDIVYFRQSNKRQAVARNQGAQLAKGKYLAFLDVDDIWLPQKLESQLIVAEANPSAVFVFSNGYRATSEGDYNEIMSQLQTYPMLSTLYTTPPNKLTLDFEFRMHCVPTSSILVKKELFFQVGGMSNVIPGEDFILCCALLGLGNAFYIEIPLIAYRVHSQNTSSNVQSKRHAWGNILGKDNARVQAVQKLEELNLSLPKVAKKYTKMPLLVRLVFLFYWRLTIGSSLKKVWSDIITYLGKNAR